MKHGRDKPIPDYKIDLIKRLVDNFKKSQTILIASNKGLPASQFQTIKNKLRGKAEIIIAKKSAVIRAIDCFGKEGIQKLKECVGSDVCIMFSNLDAFELSGVLSEYLSDSKAKVGDIATFDIIIEPGPTNLMPGPAISELGAVGLKVGVEDGKLAIKNTLTIVAEGGVVDDKIANVLGKLDINPMKVGFLPIAAYDSKEDKVYTSIRIDKAGALNCLQEAISNALGFAVSVGFVVKETISCFILKAYLEERTLNDKIKDYEEKNHDKEIHLKDKEKEKLESELKKEEVGEENKNE